jgi:hypothetical protein
MSLVSPPRERPRPRMPVLWALDGGRPRGISVGARGRHRISRFSRGVRGPGLPGAGPGVCLASLSSWGRRPAPKRADCGGNPTGCRNARQRAAASALTGLNDVASHVASKPPRTPNLRSACSPQGQRPGSPAWDLARPPPERGNVESPVVPRRILVSEHKNHVANSAEDAIYYLERQQASQQR